MSALSSPAFSPVLALVATCFTGEVAEAIPAHLLAGEPTRWIGEEFTASATRLRTAR